MKYFPAAFSTTLALILLTTLAAVPLFAQTSPLPAAADIYPANSLKGAGLPVLAADSGLGGSLRLRPRLEDLSLPFGIPDSIKDRNSESRLSPFCRPARPIRGFHRKRYSMS
jgi:hypothetical protein